MRRLTFHERRRRGCCGLDRRAGRHRQRQPRSGAGCRRRGRDRGVPAGPPRRGGLRHAGRGGRGNRWTAQSRGRRTGIARGSDRRPQRPPRHRRCGGDDGAAHAGPGRRPSQRAWRGRHEGRRGGDGRGGRGAGGLPRAGARRPGSRRRRGGRQPGQRSGHRRVAVPGHPAGRLRHRRAHRSHTGPVAARVRRGARAIRGPGGSQLATRARRQRGEPPRAARHVGRRARPGGSGPVAAISWSPSPAAATRPS